MRSLSDYRMQARHVLRRLSGRVTKEAVWPQADRAATPAKKAVWVTPYLLDHPAPYILICPGGAYQIVSSINEGWPYAEAFNRMGFHAFILHYRTREAARTPAPLEDVGQALRLLDARREEWRLQGAPILCGSSAGGHLCALFAAQAEQYLPEPASRPRALVLAYPVISMAEETNAASRDTLLGKNASPEQCAAHSVERLVTPEYPPSFFWHCTDDACVPVSNSRRFAQALEQNGVAHRYVEYPSGGHGIGLAAHTSAAGWPQEAAAFLKEIVE